METFITKRDDHLIDILIKPDSSAILTGPNKIFMTIYNESSPINWRKVVVKEINQDKEFIGSISKKDLAERPVIRIKSKFAVDDVNLKDSIIKSTALSYLVVDGNGTNEDYKTNYTDHASEFKTGSSNDETFAVVKRVHVVFV